MKRIVIFSDSLGLPRESPEVTFVEDTYPQLLRSDYQVFQLSIGGGRIEDFLLQAHYYRLCRPDYVIIQSGIVDCAPRAFSWNEELFLKSNIVGRVVRRVIATTIKTKRIRNCRKKSWTSKKQYTRCCTQLIETFQEIPVFALSILPADYEYEKKVTGIQSKIVEYNHILHSRFGDRMISLENIPRGGIMSDGHHLNKIGHQYTYLQIIKKLELFSL